MLIIETLFNENLIKAEAELNRANCDNIIALCREYLRILTEYLEDLHQIRGSSKMNLQQSSPLQRELVEQFRKAVRSTVEITTLKRNQIELLLQSFVSISGYEAVNTFNNLAYLGRSDWRLGANAVLPQEQNGIEPLTIEEAVETASRLRRDAYINDKTTFFKAV